MVSVFSASKRSQRSPDVATMNFFRIKGYGNEKDLSTAIMLFREMRNEGSTARKSGETSNISLIP